ncbi:MAG: DUF58 domain-containing protein [Coprobacillaceae bacterium]
MLKNLKSGSKEILKKVLYILLVFITFYMGGMYWSPALLLVFFIEILLFVICFIQSFYLAWNLHIRLKIDSKTVLRDNKVKGYIVVKNTSILPINAFELQWSYKNCLSSSKGNTIVNGAGAIRGKDEVYLDFDISSKHCGNIEIEIKNIKIYDYLSLFCRKLKQEYKEEIIVLPKENKIDMILSSNFIDTIQNNKDTNQLGMNITDFHIREYEDGDSIKHIHWKLTAKTEEVWTKEYFDEESYVIPIHLDLYYEEMMSLYEWDAFFEIVTAIALELLKTDIKHSISWFDIYTNRQYEYIITTKLDYVKMIIQLIETSKNLDFIKTEEYEKWKITSKESLCFNTGLQLSYFEKPILTYTTENYEEELQEKWLRI